MPKRNPTARKNPEASKYTEPDCAYRATDARLPRQFLAGGTTTTGQRAWFKTLLVTSPANR